MIYVLLNEENIPVMSSHNETYMFQELLSNINGFNNNVSSYNIINKGHYHMIIVITKNDTLVFKSYPVSLLK